MAEIIQLKPLANIPEALRKLADKIESGELEIDELTWVAPPYVGHLGSVNNHQSATSAVFNMTYGIQKMIDAVLRAED